MSVRCHNFWGRKRHPAIKSAAFLLEREAHPSASSSYRLCRPSWTHVGQTGSSAWTSWPSTLTHWRKSWSKWPETWGGPALRSSTFLSGEYIFAVCAACSCVAVHVKKGGQSEPSDPLNTNGSSRFESGMREEVDERLMPGKIDVREQNSSGSCGG